MLCGAHLTLVDVVRCGVHLTLVDVSYEMSIKKICFILGLLRSAIIEQGLQRNINIFIIFLSKLLKEICVN